MGLVSRRQDEDDEQGPEFLITGFGDLDGPSRADVEIDLADWDEAGRAALDERLHLLEAPHSWNGSWLVVAEDDIAWIEGIIEQVEGERAVELDPDADQVAYDLAGWDDANRQRLIDGLEDEAIAYGIEADELVVHEIDEQRVDELVDAILEPDAPPPAGGEARTEIMGELFVAADRLVHDLDDHGAFKALVAGTAEATSHAPPYGMDKAWWTGIGERGSELVELVQAPSRDGERATEQAILLRDLLRPYV